MAPSPVEELALLDLERSNKGASKQRRDQINGEIGTMRDLLPLQESARQRLSQLQIMSLSCVYIRKCNVLQKMLPPNRCTIDVPCEFSSALTGFILVTSRDGKLIYISENVTEYLGHSMVDMKTQGDSLFDIVDKRDHGTVQAQLLHGVAHGDAQPGRKVSFFCRMNMSRTLKRQGGFGDVKVMHVKGHFIPVSGKEGGSGEQHVFMALCTPLITPDVKESLIQNNTMIFKSVHKLDMNFIEITETGEFHLGLTNEEIQGKSWYSMLHPEDLTEARAKHIQLIKSRHEMGCMMTVRMLTNANEIIWVNIVMHVRQALMSNSDDPVIVCINQVVSEEEAKQFKIQGQLFVLYAARAPDIFFSGHHYSTVPQPIDSEMMGRSQMFLHQQPFFGEQQRFQYGPQHPSTQMAYPQQPNQYGVSGTNIDNFGQRAQGHTSTIKALKRKLQENFISSCKPAKLARIGPSENQGGVGGSDFIASGDTQYIMNVDVFSSPNGMNMYNTGRDISGFNGGAMPMVHQTARINPVQAIHNKKALLVNAIAPVMGTPDVVQKLAPSCTLEQVVPEVSIPDCYLTPDPSPATSPKPNTSGQICTQQPHEIKQLTTYVMERLNELKQNQTKTEASTTKAATNEAKKKNLPVFDATFVESFFDDLDPALDKEVSRVEVKLEPLSPPPRALSQDHSRSALPDYGIMTSKTPSPPPSYLPKPPSSDIAIKEELTFEDCSDLEELFGLVGTAGPNQLTMDSPQEHFSPVSSPNAQKETFSEPSPISSYKSSFGSPIGADQPEMSPGSSSPCYDGRDDIMEPDNWLLEPISLSLDLSLTDIDNTPCDVKVEAKDDDLYHLKQLLHQTWAPCGSQASHKNTQ